MSDKGTAAADPTWGEIHQFLTQAIRARDEGALKYGIFAATR